MQNPIVPYHLTLRAVIHLSCLLSPLTHRLRGCLLHLLIRLSCLLSLLTHWLRGCLLRLLHLLLYLLILQSSPLLLRCLLMCARNGPRGVPDIVCLACDTGCWTWNGRRGRLKHGHCDSCLTGQGIGGWRLTGWMHGATNTSARWSSGGLF